MSALPTILQAERRTTRLLFCAAARGRSNGTNDLWSKQWRMYRSDKKETAESFSPSHQRALLQHSRIQSWVPVLPKLGHLQSARVGQARGLGIAGADRSGSAATRLPIGRVHLQ